ncbi:hypothetical protein EVAR_76490_1 [Eumeta japonica]|uniref:Uncharacterized protein n=1 Tax=Eumeta variegata TaxID=151549 RepID=A0A4C1T7N2_EUMVA|nr:hypothetical protein EVAR_76490_1 [Eumeta japonica]
MQYRNQIWRCYQNRDLLKPRPSSESKAEQSSKSTGDKSASTAAWGSGSRLRTASRTGEPTGFVVANNSSPKVRTSVGVGGVLPRSPVVVQADARPRQGTTLVHRPMPTYEHFCYNFNDNAACLSFGSYLTYCNRSGEKSHPSLQPRPAYITSSFFFCSPKRSVTCQAAKLTSPAVTSFGTPRTGDGLTPRIYGLRWTSPQHKNIFLGFECTDEAVVCRMS